MFNKKLIISLVMFSFFMVFTSIIKTKTRLIEKNINLNERQISILESVFEIILISGPNQSNESLNGITSILGVRTQDRSIEAAPLFWDFVNLGFWI